MTVVKKTKRRISIRDVTRDRLEVGVCDNGGVFIDVSVTPCGGSEQDVWLTLEDAKALCAWMRRRIREVEKKS